MLRLRPKLSVRSRLVGVSVIVLFASTIHLLTGGRWTMVLVLVGGTLALLTALPRIAWLAKPVGMWTGLWLVFNLLRAGADNTAWVDQVVGLVPRLEATLAAGRLPSALLQERFHTPGNLAWHDHALTAIYLSFFVIPHAVAALLLWRNRLLFWRYTIATALVFAVAAVSFYLIPTSPPWLVSELVSSDFAPIRRITEPAIASLDLPVQLFSEGTRNGARTSEVRMEPNPIAAMPSIHMATTAMIIGPARRVGRVMLVITAVDGLLMGIALVYLGEHYIVDLVAGSAIAAAGWKLAGHWLSATDADSLMETNSRDCT